MHNQNTAAANIIDGKVKKDITVKTKEKPLKLSFNEQREYAEIDTIIAEIEVKIKKLQEKIDQAFDNYVLLQQLLDEKEDLEKQLEEKMERWVYLNELAEKISKV